jgi:opacity protein-like surface antigen
MTRVLSLAALAIAGLAAAASPAAAQITLGPITGALTGHIGTGSASEGASGTTLAGGLSVAVVEQTGWGAEFDAGFASDDGGKSGGLHAQTYMLGVTGVWPRGRLRPFGVLSGGVVRARTCTTASCAATVGWSDWGLSAGGGVHYLMSESFALRGDVRYFGTLTDHPDPGRTEGLKFWRVGFGATFLWVAD